MLRDDHTLISQKPERTRNSVRGYVVFVGELSTGWQLRADRELLALDALAQGFGDLEVRGLRSL
nr:hypothetical protein [Murinocardiopsis flavida]